jgi:hypothetical protein
LEKQQVPVASHGVEQLEPPYDTDNHTISWQSMRAGPLAGPARVVDGGDDGGRATRVDADVLHERASGWCGRMGRVALIVAANRQRIDQF